MSCPVSKQRVYAPKMGGARNATEDEFVMHGVPSCLDTDPGERLLGVGLSGARVESLPRRVTILAARHYHRSGDFAARCLGLALVRVGICAIEPSAPLASASNQTSN